MSTPTLYIKEGCPYCAAAMDYLNDHQIAFNEIEVRGDEEKMKTLKDISGQSRTPTMVWDGKVLADFGVDELKEFLAQREVAKT